MDTGATAQVLEALLEVGEEGTAAWRRASQSSVLKDE